MTYASSPVHSASLYMIDWNNCKGEIVKNHLKMSLLLLDRFSFLVGWCHSSWSLNSETELYSHTCTCRVLPFRHANSNMKSRSWLDPSSNVIETSNQEQTITASRMNLSENIHKPSNPHPSAINPFIVIIHNRKWVYKTFVNKNERKTRHHHTTQHLDNELQLSQEPQKESNCRERWIILWNLFHCTWH